MDINPFLFSAYFFGVTSFLFPSYFYVWLQLQLQLQSIADIKTLFYFLPIFLGVTSDVYQGDTQHDLFCRTWVQS